MTQAFIKPITKCGMSCYKAYIMVNGKEVMSSIHMSAEGARTWCKTYYNKIGK